jgi:hypothetical protein
MKLQEYNKFAALIASAKSVYDFSNILKKLNCYKTSTEKTALLALYNAGVQAADKHITSITIKKQPAATTLKK